jgi:transposase-like protein
MAKKKQTDKQKAHMFFKRLKAGMKVADDEFELVKRYYPYGLYWDDEMSTVGIAKLVGVYPGTVYKWMKLYGIETRTNSESRLINTKKLSKEEIKEMYWDKVMSTLDIAKVVGVSQVTVFNWMREYCIESRPSWKGGISFEPYCNKFNNTFKESIRERDDYTCQLCGYEQLSGGRKLDVHHIHYDKENCYPDVVALCRSCNARVNGDRDFWEQYFESRLLERGIIE